MARENERFSNSHSFSLLHKGVSESRSVVSNSLWSHGLHSPWNSPGQNPGSLSLLQGISPTQGSSPDLSHYRRILYQLSHKGIPRILEWVAYPFSSGSSSPGESNQCPALQAILYQLSYQGLCKGSCQLVDSLVAQMVKRQLAVREPWVRSLGREDPLVKGRLPTPVFWPGEFPGRRSLAGYSPWGRRVGHNWETSLVNTN